MNLLASIRGGFGTTCVSIVELPNNSTIGNDGSAGREASLPSHDRQRSSLTLAWLVLPKISLQNVLREHLTTVFGFSSFNGVFPTTIKNNQTSLSIRFIPLMAEILHKLTGLVSRYH